MLAWIGAGGSFLGCVERGAVKSNQASIYDQLCDSNPLLLTANTDTVYCIAMRPSRLLTDSLQR